MTKQTAFLVGKRLYLRPVELKDAKLFYQYVNDPEVRHYLATIYPITQIAEESWIKKTSEVNEGNIVLAVVLKKNNKVLGTMGLHKINHVNGTASTGTLLGAKEEWNKGYAKEAKMLLLDYAFNTLNLRKICSDAYAPNKASIAHNMRCGYKIEGYLKKHIYRDGKYNDMVLLAVFKEDWLKLQKK